MKTKKYIILLLILSISTFSLSGCQYSRHTTIDDLAYVVALGIDVGKSNTLQVSFQILIPSSSSGESSQSDKSIVNSVECNSIEAGINIMNSYISKEINLAHCKAIVISEKLASEGISETIFTLMNDIQVRPDCSVIISRCDSAYFLKNSKPVLEKLTARYYDIAPTSSEYTGYTEDVTLIDLFYRLNTSTGNPIAILGGINESNSTDLQNALSPVTAVERDSSYKANETPIKSKPNIENMGLAVFKDDILIGELNAIETLCHLMIVNKLKTCTISVPSPFVEGDIVDIKIVPSTKSHTQVKLINGSPYISVEIELNARVVSLSKASNDLSNENIKKIEKYADSYIKYQVEQYLYKTSKILGCDIDDFGRYATKKFATQSDWEEYNWIDNYCNSFFNVTISTNILSGNLLTQT